MGSRRFTDRPDRIIRQLSEPCSFCGKVSYPTRADAKSARKKFHPSQGLNVYRCIGNDLVFHLGHLPPDVVRGDASRDDLRSRNVLPTQSNRGPEDSTDRS